MRAITQHLKRQGYSVVDESFYNQIALWMSWYQGKVSSFHNYRQYNGKKKIARTRASLAMGKKVAEDWADLLLNEKVNFVLANEQAQQTIDAVLSASNFRVRGNRLLELAFALGTGALVEYKDGEDVKIDYIRAGMMYPLAWENGEISECAFGSERVADGKRFVYLNSHIKNAKGFYVIKNEMFIRNGDTLAVAALPEGVLPEVNTGSELPLFQIVGPNLVNNVALDCPMGVSVYANAIDVLQGLDLVYDSYCNEFRLGKKRIVVPIDMAQTVMEADGSATPVFDDNDTEFYAITADDQTEKKIQEINMELRSEPHEAALKSGLNLLSSKCGLGNDRYNFEKGNLKTATEVVSEKSELYQSLKKHELLLEKALVGMIRSIAFLSGLYTDFNITINFDDSIIEDVNAEKLRFLQEIRDGVRQKYEYRVEFLGEDEATAKRMTAEGLDDDTLMGFGANNNVNS